MRTCPPSLGRTSTLCVSDATDLVGIGILLARPTADAKDLAELTGFEVQAAEELLARLEADGAIERIGRA